MICAETYKIIHIASELERMFPDLDGPEQVKFQKLIDELNLVADTILNEHDCED